MIKEVTFNVIIRDVKIESVEVCDIINVFILFETSFNVAICPKDRYRTKTKHAQTLHYKELYSCILKSYFFFSVSKY